MVSCTEKSDRPESIANPSDYASIVDSLSTAKSKILVNYNSSIAFWENKLTKQPRGYLYMQKLATLYQKKFMLTGDVQLLNLASKSLEQANELNPLPSVSVKHQLASNAISRHDFKTAVQYQFDALQIGEKEYLSNLLLFDGLMETGEFKSAAKLLNRLPEKESFGYLIRASKLEDHLGDLESAIFHMEQALAKVRQDKGELYLWALSNLGDMYGHAGNIKDAYQSYLEVLHAAPYYDYALKGIAWIAFAHDQNVTEAKRLLSIIKANRVSSPDITLKMAEMAEFEGDLLLKNRYLNSFKEEVSLPAYGKMYHKHLAIIAAEEEKSFQQAIQLAGQEIKNRATPQSYELLAWSYYQMGEYEKAYAVGKNYVDGATFEPEAAYHLGLIYLAAGEKNDAYRLLKEAKESAFELGPNVMQKITAYTN